MFADTAIFNWVILPLLIYIARITDVTLGTMRIISLSRGLRNVAPILGFFEMLIWLLAIRQIFNHLNNPACYLAFAGGFATGVYTGMLLEHKLAMGLRILRIITRYDATNLIRILRQEGYGLTVIDGEGNQGQVKIIFTLVKRRDLAKVLNYVRKNNPKAFYTIEDVRSAEQGIFPANGIHSTFWTNFLRYEKKAK